MEQLNMEQRIEGSFSITNFLESVGIEHIKIVRTFEFILINAGIVEDDLNSLNIKKMEALVKAHNRAIKENEVHRKDFVKHLGRVYTADKSYKLSFSASKDAARKIVEAANKWKKVESSHPNINEEGFGIHYRDPHNTRSSLSEYLVECFKCWKGGFLAPYVALFQSSGWGKSRTVNEIGQQSKYFHSFIYIPFTTGTGFPKRTLLASTFLRVLEAKDDDIKEADTEKTIKHYSEICEKFLLASLEIVSKRKTDKVTLQVNEQNEIEQLFLKYVHQGHEAPLLELPLEKINLFAFDEARALITDDNDKLFRSLRRALASVGVKYNIFALVMDTTSRISNFAPVKEKDPSARSVNRGKNLFAPFIYFLTLDVLAEEHNPKSKSLYAFIRNARPAEFWKLGRPLWGATATDDLLTFAIGKLLGGMDLALFSQLATNVQKPAVLAVLASQHCLNIHPQVALASELVASHMATCLYISPDRHIVAIDYPSEPILSDAAEMLLRNNENFSFALDVLFDYLANGTVDKGQIGELVARIILLRCISKCRTDSSSSVSVQRFLEELGVEKLKSVIDVQSVGTRSKDESNTPSQISKTESRMREQMKRLYEGVINFSHFVAVKQEPTLETLQKFVLRRAALVLQPNAKGLDLVIPVVLNSSEITVLSFQVKNYASTSSQDIEKARSKMNLSRCFKNLRMKKLSQQPHLCVLMALECKKPIQFDFKHTRELNALLMIKCLENQKCFPFLTASIREKLRRLIDLSDDAVTNLATSEELTKIELLHPLKFGQN